MFKKKVYKQINDDQRRREEREKLTQQFHKSLKSLQQKEHVDGATIVSNETSNNLCSVLEAVFLHGLKDNVMSKLVSYAQGVQTEVRLNFWHVVKRFTHKDVVDQLKQLTQINSDTGFCRAWVRLAVNDGLMASYLASMTADTKAMTGFYQSWAYLLDYEQPEILRNHLTGLMGLNFHLSLNSSVLNKWSTTTLTLAGLALDNPTPTPVIRSATPTPPTSRRHSQSSITSMDSLSGKTSDLSPPSSNPPSTLTTMVQISIPTTTISTPPNIPADPSFFHNPHEVEIFKRLSTGFAPSSVSSASSGQSSCPDPSDSHVMDNLSARSSRNNSPRSSPFDPSRFMTREDRKMEEEAKLKSILHHLDQKALEREQEERRRKDGEKEKRNWEKEWERQRDAKKKEREELEKEKMKQIQKERNLKERKEKKKELDLHSPNYDLVHKGPPEKLQVKKSFTEKSHIETESDQMMENTKQEGGSVKSLGEIVQQGALQGGEGLTSNTNSLIDSIKDAATTLVDTVQADNEQQMAREMGGAGREEVVLAERGAGSFGNSLNALDGWSSHSPYHPVHSRPDLEQSYESMLKGYIAGQEDRPIASVQDVIDGLPGSNLGKGKQSTSNKPPEPFTAVDMSDDEIDFGDYEIIHSSAEDSDTMKLEQIKTLCRYVGKNTQNNVCATPSCSVGVGFFHGPGQVCHFDGHTYCDQCHLSQSAYIPAEIVFNWSFKKRKVCAENFNFLQRMQDQPIVHIDEMSMNIYSTVPLMNNVMQLRTRLTSLRSYMFTCSESTARQLKDRVWPREHLYNDVHTYSVSDLLEVRSGKLEVFLKETVELCMKHVYSCTLCLAKGFYCELCQEPTPIFPFQTSSTVKCKSCKNVYHSRCKTDTIPCPKCTRYSQRGIRRQTLEDDDYACSPE